MGTFSLFMMPYLLLTLMFGGENSLTGYLDPRAYWTAQGIEYELEAMAELLQEGPAANKEDIQNRIDQLGANSYQEREAASLALQQIGALARPWLETASQSKDPEVAQRAKTLLKEIKSENTETSARDKTMALFTLSRMQDPEAAVLLKTIAAGSDEDLSRQATALLETPEKETAPLPDNEVILSGFPADTRFVTQMRPDVGNNEVLKAVHQSSAIQQILVNAYLTFGDLKVHRLTLSVNEGVFLQKDPRVILRIEMDYDLLRLTQALEKSKFQRIDSELMAWFRRNEISIFLPDARNMIVYLDFQNRAVAEPSDVLTLMHVPDKSSFPENLRTLMQGIPEEKPIRGALVVSEQAMADLQDFSPLRKATFQVDAIDQNLRLILWTAFAGDESAQEFNIYLQNEISKIKGFLQGENEPLVPLMREALNTMETEIQADQIRMLGKIPGVFLQEVVNMLDKYMVQVQHIQRM